MRRPINWLVAALSLTFLVAGRSMSPVAEPVDSILVSDDLPVGALSFEPAGRPAVPASVRRERDLDFGYVRLEQAQLPY